MTLQLIKKCSIPEQISGEDAYTVSRLTPADPSSSTLYRSIPLYQITLPALEKVTCPYDACTVLDLSTKHLYIVSGLGVGRLYGNTLDPTRLAKQYTLPQQASVLDYLYGSTAIPFFQEASAVLELNLKLNASIQQHTLRQDDIFAIRLIPEDFPS